MEQDARYSPYIRAKLLHLFHLVLLLAVYTELNADEPAGPAQTISDSLIDGSSRNPILKIDYRKQRLINQTLLRDSRQRELLTRFEQLMLDETIVEAVILFQQILDHENDSFDWTRNGELISIKRNAQSLLEHHPDAGKVDKKLYSGKATRLYDPKQPETWKQTTNRYFYTPAGLTAQKKLAAKAWDEGRFEEVTQRFLKIINSPIHRKQISSGNIRQARLAASLSGNKRAQKEIDQFIRNSGLFPSNLAEELAATSENLLSWFQQQNHRHPRSWKQPRQSGKPNLFAHDTAPMHEPEWIYLKGVSQATPLLNDQQRKLQSTLQKWSSLQQEHLFPEISSQFAVVADNLLIFRDFDSIQAIQLPGAPQSEGLQTENEIIWKFKSPSPVSTALATNIDPYTGITSNHPSIERLHLANSVSGALTANHETVFLIDSVERVRKKIEIQTASLESPAYPHPQLSEQPIEEYLTNRIVALPVHNRSKTPVPRWTIDRTGWQSRETETIHKHPLAGHYFFGPPTISHHTAYILSEHHSLILLSALECSTGRFLWSQPISYTDRPLEYDISRATRASLPVCTDNAVICDNGNGHLIALDPTTGNFLWLYCYADEDSRQDSGRWTYTQSTQASHAGVMNLPVPLGERIIILPDRSRRIQCCDIRSGELIWTRPRNDVQYIAAATVQPNKHGKSRDLLLCISNRSRTALEPKNGKETWQTKTGIISGHGVQLGNLFLLPVDTEELSSHLQKTDSVMLRGRIETIDLLNGKRIENGIHTTIPNCSRQADPCLVHNNAQAEYYPCPLGNLIVCEDRVISVGIDRVVSYAQAGSVARELKQAQTALSEKQLQQLAQAEMILGNQNKAIHHLRRALLQPLALSSDREQTRNIFREILYRELQSSHRNQEEILSQIAELVSTPRQKARLLASKIDIYQRQCDREKLFLATIQFTNLEPHAPHIHCDQQSYQLTATSRLPGLYRQFLEQLTRKEKEQFFTQIEQTWLNRIDTMATHQLQSLANIFSGYSQLDPVLFELAQRAASCGNYQQAEPLLLRLQRSSSESSKIVATRKLSTMYSQLGLYKQIDSCRDLIEPSRQPALLAGKTKSDEKNRQSNSLIHNSANILPLHHVSIKQQPSLSMIHKDPYNKRRTIFSNPKQNWTLLHQPDLPASRSVSVTENKTAPVILQAITNSGSPADSYNEADNEQMLSFLDRATGQNQFDIKLPGTRFGLASCTRKQVGHLLPVVASGSLYGISLIEGKTVWQRKVSRLKSSKQRIELGPVGRGFCIYQTARSLVCLNPENGNLLWKRSDLEPRGGLWANRHTGLIGDERCIVYFHADQNHYTLLDRETGSILAKGVLAQGPFLVQRTRRAFGRKMMYLAVCESQPHLRYLRLWDPLGSSLLIDEPFGVQDLYSVSDHVLTVLFSEGRLLIYHPEQERTIANINFDADEMGTTNYLRVARQGEMYLVNLYRSQRTSDEQGYTSRFTESPWNVTHINGPVLAISRRTGELKWIRSFSNRTIINEQIDGLPMLLMCATYQSRPGDQQRSMLLEILDLKTGNTLASRKDLALTRLLLLNHNQPEGEVHLSGILNDIVIKYRNETISRLKQQQPAQSDFALYAVK